MFRFVNAVERYLDHEGIMYMNITWYVLVLYAYTAVITASPPLLYPVRLGMKIQ